jgi:predicted lipoprotein with Yx(FWY)xxD motif
MARTCHQALSGPSPSQAGGRRQHLLKCGAAESGLAAASVLVAACGSSGGSTASSGAGSTGKAAAAKAVVSTRQLTGIGTVLVSTSGMTIYTPKTPAETSGSFKCTGPCLSFWFPVTTRLAHPGSSGLPGKPGTVHLSDGATQLTYDGRPSAPFGWTQPPATPTAATTPTASTASPGRLSRPAANRLAQAPRRPRRPTAPRAAVTECSRHAGHAPGRETEET